MKITTEFDLLSRHGWITSDRKAAEVLVLAGSVILLFRWKGNFAWLDPFACTTEKKYQSSRRRNVATVLLREILALYTCLFCNWPCWLLCPYTDYHKSPIVFKDTSKIWDKNLSSSTVKKQAEDCFTPITYNVVLNPLNDDVPKCRMISRDSTTAASTTKYLSVPLPRKCVTKC